MTDQFKLIRGANVEVKHIINEKKQNVAEITINDKFQHRFDPKSRVSKHLDLMTAQDLQDRLNGGTYFLVDDQLVDFRDGLYNGFIHSDAGVATFMDILGYQDRSTLPLHRGNRRRRGEDDHSDIVLRKVWSDGEIIVPGYAHGGDFTSQLSFTWNPFVKTINSSFDLIRQICTNGMVGLTSFLNTKIPLFNRWEEHLDIASTQIQNKVNAVVIDRVQQMALERASVADCLLLSQHAFDRLYAPGEKTTGERDRLVQLMAALSPQAHLSHVYQAGVFEDKNRAAQLPAHLSNFDAFNIATELRTHTSQTAKSSDTALDKFANSILFDREDNYVATASRMTAPKQAAFSDPEKAFWGTMD